MNGLIRFRKIALTCSVNRLEGGGFGRWERFRRLLKLFWV